MTQRGIIRLGGADPRFRISKPGKDVSSTDIEDFLMHEGYLFGQVMALGVAVNPGSGGGYEAVIDVGYDLGDIVHIEVYHVYSGSGYFFPCIPLYSVGTPITVPNVVWSVSGSVMTIDFGSNWASSAYYVVYKA